LSWFEGVDCEALAAGRAVRLNPPRGGWFTPTGKIQWQKATFLPSGVTSVELTPAT
jgi:hypothetical protein